MAESPEAVVRAQFDAVNRRDWKAAMALYGNEPVLVVPEFFLSPGTYTGRRSVGGWFGDWMQTFGEQVHFDITRAREVGDGVALSAHHIARGGISGAEVEADLNYVYRVRDGKIDHVQFYESWDAAMDALGVSDSPR
jgi:ketosteroid isomerase-like protein